MNNYGIVSGWQTSRVSIHDLIQVAVVEYHVSQHMEMLVKLIMTNMTSVDVADYNYTCVAGCGSGVREWGR